MTNIFDQVLFNNLFYSTLMRNKIAFARVFFITCCELKDKGDTKIDLMHV